MDDINKTIENIMADPQKLKMLQGMASQLFGDGAQSKPSAQEKSSSPEIAGGGDILANAKNLGSLISAAGSIGSQKDDSSVQLLLALRAHLKDERKARVDTAVKILRLIRLAPILKNSGLINL